MSDLPNDPRRSLLSASKFARAANCPGSVALENEIRSRGRHYELPDSARASGIKIHEWLALEALGKALDETNLSSDERATAKMCVELRNNSLASWDRGGKETQLFIEKRFWYRRGARPLFSGQPDYVKIDYENHRALILDYKTGRLEAEEAADSLQLRAEVVLIKDSFEDLQEISAGIIEPWISWDSVHVIYRGDSLREAQNQVLAIADSTVWDADKRVAGHWCRYCSAKAYCSEAIEFAQKITKFYPEKMVAELPRGEAGTTLWEKVKVAKKLLEAIEAAYTRILEDVPDALPGYILPEKGKARRRVVYPERLKEALKDYLSGPEVDGCAEYRLGKIEELLRIKHKIIDDKEVKALVKTLTADAVTITYDMPSIRAVTKRERETNTYDRRRVGT
jgi:hypothetical protein